jgi:hypothetical protein
MPHLVDRHPVLYPIAEPLKQHDGVSDKVLNHLLVVEEAPVFLLLRQGLVPVEDGHPGSNVGFEQGVDLDRASALVGDVM